jgi:hypothetical protein
LQRLQPPSSGAEIIVPETIHLPPEAGNFPKRPPFHEIIRHVWFLLILKLTDKIMVVCPAGISPEPGDKIILKGHYPAIFLVVALFTYRH